jgi:hypothetical protein
MDERDARAETSRLSDARPSPTRSTRIGYFPILPFFYRRCAGPRWTTACSSARNFQRGSQMKKIVALLYIAFANFLLLGQSLSPRPLTSPPVKRFEPLSMRLPPTLIAPIKDPGAATLMRSNCVYPALATRSVSIRPCGTSPRKLRLFPPFERIAPTPKPAKPPIEIR